MVLDKIYSHLEIQVEAFAVCDVRQGWSLDLVPPANTVLHFVLDGHGAMRVGSSGEYELAVDRLALVPAGVGHSLAPDGPHEHRMQADSADIPRGSGVHRIQAGEGPPGVLVACGKIRATYGGIAGLFDRVPDPIDLDFSDSPGMQAAFRSLLEEQAAARPGSDVMTTALMNQCFVLFLRRLGAESSRRLPWLEAIADAQLGSAIDAVLEHPESSHSVDSLAELAGMSRSTFTDHFRKAFDRSPMDFVRETRLQRGARLLRTTDLAVKQIARRVGLHSRSHFSQAFSQSYGVSPKRYRLGAEAH